MSVGVVVPLPAYTLDPAFIAKKAEDLGFESIWYHEHPILPVNSASPHSRPPAGRFPGPTAHFSEPYISLAMAAAVTEQDQVLHGHHPGTGAEPADPGQGNLGAGPAQQRPFRLRHRRGLEPRGDRDDGRRLRSSLDADPGGRGWRSRSCGPRMRRNITAATTISRRSTCTPSPCSSRTRPSCWAAWPATCCSGWPAMATAGCPTG